MELEQLQTLWKDHDEKLDKSLKMNMQLLRQVNLMKAGNKLKKLLYYKLAEMAVLLFMLKYLWRFIVQYINEPGFWIPAILLVAFITAGFISDVRQLVLIREIRRGSDAPVAVLQKNIEKLKLLVVNYVKFSFISIPLYPLLMIVGGKMFFGADCWALQHRPFLIANFITGLFLVPLFLWIYRGLSRKHIKQSWINNLLTGSGWNQANDAHRFLMQIETFENESGSGVVE